MYPYATYRKHKSREIAIQFLYSRQGYYAKTHEDIKSYGEIMTKYITASIIILPDAVCYNLCLNNSFTIRLDVDPDDPLTSVRYKGNYIFVKDSRYRLNPDSLRSFAVAVHRLLSLLGDFVDIELSVPDMSCFYLLTLPYMSKIPEYRRLRQLLDQRLGKVAVTVTTRQYIESEGSVTL